jgi:hypothetical protein
MLGLISQDDTLTQEGADALAEKIRAFWKKRNKFPQVWVQRTVDSAGDAFIFVVRSDLELSRKVRP